MRATGGWMRGSGAVLLAAVLAAGCDNPVQKAESPRPTVEGDVVVFPAGSAQLAALASQPVERSAAPGLALSGRLVWDEDVTVRLFSPFPGRVARVLVQPGERVRAGQPLAAIASPEVGQAQSDARRAEADLGLAQQNLLRIRELVDHGVAPRKDLISAEAEHARADAEWARSRARLSLYGASARAVDQSLVLVSPIAGTVVERSINAGQEVRPDQQVAAGPPLFVVTDPSRLWMQLDANERDIGRLAAGRSVRITTPAWPDQRFVGRITAVADFIDPATRTMKVRGTVDNADRRLKGEMYVTGELGNDAAEQFTVPPRAVYLQGGRHYLFTEEAGGRFQRREVQVADERDGRLPVLSGLATGQKVVVDGTLLLQQLLQPRRITH